MRILAIETSCDETAISILEGEGTYPDASLRVLGDLTLTQAQLHAEYGGVFPNLAKREHENNLIPVLRDVLAQADMDVAADASLSASQQERINEILEREPELARQSIAYLATIATPDIDVIAVTHGPGLAPALWTGINFAKVLSTIWNVPIIPVNHMEGHMLSSLIAGKDDRGVLSLHDVTFPVVGLLISGGHTDLISLSRLCSYTYLGRTRDDAVGEAFDKVARLLGLSYPGGPEISRLAAEGSERKELVLPRPMLDSGDLDFSFSGIKTAVRYRIGEETLSEQEKADNAYAFERAVADVLARKTAEAAEKVNARTVVIGGGVSANERIRTTIRDALAEALPEVTFLIPPPWATTDNALMIALAALLCRRDEATTDIETLRAHGTLSLPSEETPAEPA